MTHYRLAIFDFDGTLADSLALVSCLVPGHDRAVRSCAGPRRRGGRTARAVGARNHGAAQRIHVATAGHRQRHAKAQARGRKRDIAVRRHPGDAGRPATPRHQDRHRQFRQRSIRPASARTRRQPDHPLRLRRCDVRQALEISARRTKARSEAIGDDLHRRRDPRHRGRQTPPAWIPARWPGATRFRPRCRRRGRRISSIRSRR